jgi:hypothetical protein
LPADVLPQSGWDSASAGTKLMTASRSLHQRTDRACARSAGSLIVAHLEGEHGGSDAKLKLGQQLALRRASVAHPPSQRLGMREQLLTRSPQVRIDVPQERRLAGRRGGWAKNWR